MENDTVMAQTLLNDFLCLKRVYGSTCMHRSRNVSEALAWLGATHGHGLYLWLCTIAIVNGQR